MRSSLAVSRSSVAKYRSRVAGVERDVGHVQRLDVSAHRRQRRLQLVRHVGQHLAPQPIRCAQRLLARRQIDGHPVESRRHIGDLVAAPFGGARRQVAGADAVRRVLEGLQPAPRRLEDECGGKAVATTSSTVPGSDSRRPTSRAMRFPV